MLSSMLQVKDLMSAEEVLATPDLLTTIQTEVPSLGVTSVYSQVLLMKYFNTLIVNEMSFF